MTGITPIISGLSVETQKDRTSIPAPSGSVPAPPSIMDIIDIDLSQFAVETSVDDYLPQTKHLPDKKNFKNVKEYAEYLLLLYAKLQKAKPQNGEIYTKLEEQTELQKVRAEIDSLDVSNILK